MNAFAGTIRGLNFFLNPRQFGRMQMFGKVTIRVLELDIIDENVHASREPLEEELCLTVGEVASSVVLSRWSAHSIIREELEFSKFSGGPSDKNNAHLEIYHNTEKGECFLRRLFRGDDPWVHHYTPESKQASQMWRLSMRLKVKSLISIMKVKVFGHN